MLLDFTTVYESNPACRTLKLEKCYVLKNPIHNFIVMKSTYKKNDYCKNDTSGRSYSTPFVDADNNWIDMDQQAAVQLAVNLERVYRYFNKHGLKVFNNDTPTLLATIYPRSTLERACAGLQFTPDNKRRPYLRFGFSNHNNNFAHVSLTAVAHEFTHLVTGGNELNLFSPAAESLSDIFALLIIYDLTGILESDKKGYDGVIRANLSIETSFYFFSKPEKFIQVYRNICNPIEVGSPAYYYDDTDEKINTSVLSMVFCYLSAGDINNISENKLTSTPLLGIEKTEKLYLELITGSDLEKIKSMGDFRTALLKAAISLILRGQLEIRDIALIVSAFNTIGII